MRRGKQRAAQDPVHGLAAALHRGRTTGWRSAETIVSVARDQGCDRIIFGRIEPSMAGRVFGSLAQQVRGLPGTRGDFKVIGS
jgi:hypothetical protein